MKYLAWIGGAILVALAAWGSLHVFISPVNPTQQAPAGHAQSACWACHFVTDSAQVRDVAQ